MNFCEHLKLLHNADLHDDVKILANLLVGINEHNSDLLSMAAKYQVLVYYGDALLQTGEYKRAEVQYRRALQTKKAMNKGKTRHTATHMEMLSDVDIRYKIYQCLSHLKQYREAITVLEGLNVKQRTAKINMSLAKLYQRTGMDRSAITCYKEVLRECPLALEAVGGLLTLGVKGAEVASLVVNGLPPGVNPEWLSAWIKGHASAAGKDYPNAISTFKMLDTKSLRDSVEVLSSLGAAHFLNGDYQQAEMVLQRVHSIDPLFLKNMDILAYLYKREKKNKELESLGNQLMSVTEFAPQPWVAMGYFCLAIEKRTKAVYFAQKAFTFDNCCVESLLLKGRALLDLKKTPEAIVHYREALRIAPYRYEAHKGLVSCYLASHRMREAIQLSSAAYKQLGSNARSLTLYGSVLAKDLLNLEKAKPFLEKALKLDPSHLEAVYVMADIHTQQEAWEKGIELLRNQLQHQSTCRLHQLLGDFLSQTNEKQEALDQYSIALSMEPSDKKSREGMERVEKNSDMGTGLEGSYDLEVEDMDNSDNEVDLDGSEVESAWSDVSYTDNT